MFPILRPGMVAAAALAFTVGTAHAIPSSGLIAYWSGDNTTVDGSGNGHNGAWVGTPSYVPGVAGAAFNLQGTGTYVEIPDSPDWAFGSSDFTISFFANVTANVTGGTIANPAHVFIGQDEGSGNQNKWFIGLGADQLNFHVNYDSGPPIFINPQPYPTTPGEWHDIVLRRTGNTFDFFLDGAFVGSASNTALVADAVHTLRLGESEGFELQGYLDEIAIYNRSLSLDELFALADDPGPPSAPAPTPATLALFGLGLAGLALTRRRRSLTD